MLLSLCRQRAAELPGLYAEFRERENLSQIHSEAALLPAAGATLLRASVLTHIETVARIADLG